MNHTLFKSLTPTLIGTITVATVGIPQSAQAGTVTGSSQLQASNVTLELIDNDNSGDGIANLWDISFATVSAGGEINGSDPTVGIGPVACSSTPIDTRSLGELPFVVGPNNVDGAAAVDCGNPVASTSNEASIFLTGNGPTNGSSFGQYTTFSDDFEVTAGDTIDLSGTVEGLITGEITGFDGGTKIVESNFVARYDIFLDNEIVFSGPILDAADRVINQNGSYNVPVIANLGDIDYTFEDSGTARFGFFAREEASATIDRETTPEPSNIAGFFALGGIAFLLKHRKIIKAS